MVEEAIRRITEVYERVARSPYIPETPHPKQASFLSLTDDDAFYGGAAGGGKSHGLLMRALLYVDEPEYAAIILRRTRKELTLPAALLTLSHKWIGGLARWNEQRSMWTFPSGATLSFGYYETANDRRQYQSAEFDFVGVDEAGDWPVEFYDFLKSRIRQRRGARVPAAQRGAGNPGGIGESWLFDRFINEATASAPFVPATLDDMREYMDVESYDRRLALLDPVTYQQLRYGAWKVERAGKMFAREDFMIQSAAELPRMFARVVRFWDMAATRQSSKSPDPDYIAGVLMARDHEGLIYVLDCINLRMDPGDAEDLIRQTAMLDGQDVEIVVEQEPGSSGKLVAAYLRKMLRGFPFKAVPATGSKETRARPWASAVKHSEAALLQGHWNRELIDEHVTFPMQGAGIHDDIVDACSGAYGELMGRRSAEGLDQVNREAARPVPGLAIPR